jgi:DNA-binding NarL/FixJ family response regulator
MLKQLFGWGQPAALSTFDAALPREELIQNGRLAFIDDEEPLLIEQIRRSQFSVDHDRTGADLRNYEAQLYDVAIVDYYGVGQHLGVGQGLDLLKHIRRVSPRTRLIAYTSRSLNASESEFFRLSHAVLPKDMGLGDSMSLIEDQLRKSLGKEHLFEAILLKLSIASPDERLKMHSALTKALSSKNKGKFKEYVSKAVGVTAEKTVEILISKLFS